MTYPILILDNPFFKVCEFKTSDDSVYRIDALFMGFACVDFDFDEVRDFTFRQVKVQNERLIKTCEDLFGPMIDENEMVRWYWDKDREVACLRHDRDLILLKLSWQ